MAAKKSRILPPNPPIEQGGTTVGVPQVTNVPIVNGRPVSGPGSLEEDRRITAAQAHGTMGSGSGRRHGAGQNENLLQTLHDILFGDQSTVYHENDAITSSVIGGGGNSEVGPTTTNEQDGPGLDTTTSEGPEGSMGTDSTGTFVIANGKKVYIPEGFPGFPGGGGAGVDNSGGAAVVPGPGGARTTVLPGQSNAGGGATTTTTTPGGQPTGTINDPFYQQAIADRTDFEQNWATKYSIYEDQFGLHVDPINPTYDAQGNISNPVSTVERAKAIVAYYKYKDSQVTIRDYTNHIWQAAKDASPSPDVASYYDSVLSIMDKLNSLQDQNSTQAVDLRVQLTTAQTNLNKALAGNNMSEAARHELTMEHIQRQQNQLDRRNSAMGMMLTLFAHPSALFFARASGLLKMLGDESGIDVSGLMGGSTGTQLPFTLSDLAKMNPVERADALAKAQASTGMTEEQIYDLLNKQSPGGSSKKLAYSTL